MLFVPAREARGTCSAFYDNSVDISDEIPDSTIHRMELIRRAVRHPKLRREKKDWSNNVPSGRHQSTSLPSKVPAIQSSRSLSIDMACLTLSPPFELDPSSRESSSKSLAKRVSFDAEVLLHNEELFPVTLSKARKESMDSLSSEETIESEGTGDYNDSFRVLLFNKFGVVRDSVAGITDAKSVSHIYKGAVLVTDMLDSKVVWFERSGKARRTFMTKESTEPWGAIMTPDGHVAVTLRRQRCVALWSNDGQSMMELGHGLLQCPAGVAVDKSGRIFVADEQINDVLAFDQSGTYLLKLSDSGQTFKQPRYVFCSNSGRIVVADSGNHCIKVFDNSGQFKFKFGSYGRDDGQFKFPYGVCVDQHGNIIVADHYNDRVVMFSSEGEFLQTLVTSASGLRGPSGLSIRCTHNRKLYITHGGLKASEVLVFNLIPVDSDLSVNVKEFV